MEKFRNLVAIFSISILRLASSNSKNHRSDCRRSVVRFPVGSKTETLKPVASQVNVHHLRARGELFTFDIIKAEYQVV